MLTVIESFPGVTKVETLLGEVVVHAERDQIATLCLAFRDHPLLAFAFDDTSRAAITVAIAKYPPGKQASAVLPLLDIAQRQMGRTTGSAWALLESLKSGEKPKRGSTIGRIGSAPEGGPMTLKSDPTPVPAKAE
eukprot:gene2701-2740_t